jgi:hypothetical protein
VTYQTPGERESVMAAAFEALLDAGEATVEQVYEANRRVREALVEVIGNMGLCLDDGDRDVMRHGLTEAREVLTAITEGHDHAPPLLITDDLS